MSLESRGWWNKMMSYQEHVTGIATELEEILDLDDLEAKVYLN